MDWTAEDFELDCSKRYSVQTAGRGLPNILCNEYWLLVSGVKRPGREADNSPTENAQVKNTSSYISSNPYVSMA
jgi:hypothetical protein